MNKSFQLTGTYTDQYQLTMAQAYFLRDKTNDKAVFDYFFRKLPFDGGYAIFAGLENLLDVLEDLHFDENDIRFLKDWGFDLKFIDYLKGFQFKGSIYSSQEGDLIFPTRPILRVEGNIIEAQIIETVLLNILNFQSLIATKASRMRLTAGDRTLIDFGMRRAHGLAAYHASRAAIIGGFEATSNVKAGIDFDIPVSGTMAHSFVQSFDDELNAFRYFAEIWSENCILLVDTYNTLKSGIPNAIKVAKELKSKGHQLKGIRLDSGDLAYLAKKSRKMLDEAGLTQVQIFASNQLDEYLIKSLLDQNAPIDGFGVGTRLVTGQPDAAFDGVYKLAYAYGKSRIKISENEAKTTLPDKKQVHRMYDSHQQLIGADIITLADETDFDEMQHPIYSTKKMSLKDCEREALLQPVMISGKRVNEEKSVIDLAKFSKSRLYQLPLEYKRFNNPHVYKIGLSSKLKMQRHKIIEESKKHYNT